MVQTAASADRRREILAAASRLFRERGLHEAGMREIAAALGRSAGNLYYYFPSKQELLAYCQETTLDALLALARAAAADDGPVVLRLKRLLAGHVVLLNETYPGSLAHLEVEALPPARRRPILARRRRYEAALRDLVEAGIAAGELRPVDASLAVLALLGALNWTVKWFSPAGEKSAAQVGAELADLLTTGLVAAHRMPASRGRRRRVA